jgi:integrase
MVNQLRVRLHAEWGRQGEPRSGGVCPPRHRSESGLLSLNELSKRVVRTWRQLGLEPIGLQDSRHTAATWLDHAGVSPKVASTLMGHKTPTWDLRYGAAPITLRRYTHVLEGELDRARDLFEAFLIEREAEERKSHRPTRLRLMHRDSA